MKYVLASILQKRYIYIQKIHYNIINEHVGKSQITIQMKFIGFQNQMMMFGKTLEASNKDIYMNKTQRRHATQLVDVLFLTSLHKPSLELKLFPNTSHEN